MDYIRSGTSIPDKTYFKIGEVCRLTGIKSHTLRHWEAEFKVLKPQRANSRQRLYRRADIENILLIKKMIQDDGLTLNGAKKALAKGTKSHSIGRNDWRQLLVNIKAELIDIKKTMA